MLKNQNIYSEDLEDLLQLVVQDQHKGATHAPEHVGQGSLEEGLAALTLDDLPPAVHGSRVHDVGCGGGRHRVSTGVANVFATATRSPSQRAKGLLSIPYRPFS